MKNQRMSKEELIKRVQVLEREAFRASNFNSTLLSFEESIQTQTHTLRERVKELTCVYETIRLFRRIDLPLNEKLHAIAELIPCAMQYPEGTCARIIVNQEEFKTNNFDPSAQGKISSGILSSGMFIGLVEARCCKECSKKASRPFLHEEEALIRVLAELIGLSLEKITALTASAEFHPPAL